MTFFISRFSDKLKKVVALVTYEEKRKFQNMQSNLEKCKNKVVKFLYSMLNRLGDIEECSSFRWIPQVR